MPVYGKRRREGKKPKVVFQLSEKEKKILELEAQLLGKPKSSVLAECFVWDFLRKEPLVIPEEISIDFPKKGKLYTFHVYVDHLTDVDRIRALVHRAGLRHIGHRARQYLHVIAYVRPLAMVKYLHASQMLSIFEKIYWGGLTNIPGSGALEERIKKIARDSWSSQKQEFDPVENSESWKRICEQPIKAPTRKPKQIFTEGCEVVCVEDLGDTDDDDCPLFIQS